MKIKLCPQDAYTVGARQIMGPQLEDGRHQALLSQAWKLWWHHYEIDEIGESLRDWLGRAPRPNEIEDVLQKLCDGEGDGYFKYRSSYKKSFQPEPLDVERILECFEQYGGCDELMALPGNEVFFDYIKGENKQLTAKEWLNQLFKPGELLCVGYRAESTKVKALEAWDDQHLYYAVYASPCTYETNARGRCDANVQYLPYFVLEFDYSFGSSAFFELACRYNIEHDPDACVGFGLHLQAGVILHLIDVGFPVVSVIFSGRKSLHCWCSSFALDWGDMSRDELYAKMCAFGVDEHGRTKSQFMRICNPYNWKRPQPILYHSQKFLV